MQQQDRMSDQDIDKLLEDFDFSAITDGLGFHHSVSESKTIEKSLNQKANELDQDFKRHIQNIKTKNANSNLNRGDLAPFYEQEKEPKAPAEKIQELIEKENQKMTIFKAQSFERFTAWSLDLLIITTLAMATVLLAFYFAGLSVSPATGIEEGALLFLSMTISYYLLYFSVLDSTEHSTFGKRLFGIKVVKNMKVISFSLAFRRSAFCLLSSLLVGLPALLKAQDVFFGTIVVKR